MGKVNSLQNRLFGESAFENKASYLFYFDRFAEISLSCGVWNGFPDSVETRYLEKALFTDGAAVLYYDDVLEKWLALRVMKNGQFDVYGNPVYRTAIAANGYTASLNE